MIFFYHNLHGFHFLNKFTDFFFHFGLLTAKTELKVHLCAVNHSTTSITFRIMLRQVVRNYSTEGWELEDR